jgi:dTMP kinase
MKIITISGLDGSGKSTQVEMLKKYLEILGKKVFYFHAVQFSVANKLSGRKKAAPSRGVTKSSWIEIILRRIFLMLDLSRFKILARKLCRKGYDFLVSDRYFYDTVVNIDFLRKNDRKIRCENFITKPDLAIYLSAEPNMIMQRERRPDQGIEYLIAKNDIFDKKYEEWGLKFMDGNRGKEVIFSDLKELINREL